MNWKWRCFVLLQVIVISIWRVIYKNDQNIRKYEKIAEWR